LVAGAADLLGFHNTANDLRGNIGAINGGANELKFSYTDDTYGAIAETALPLAGGALGAENAVGVVSELTANPFTRGAAYTKAAAGFVLGYEGAAATGTESTPGKVGAGLVGAVALAGGGGAIEFLRDTQYFNLATATMTVGAVSATAGEYAVQFGDHTVAGEGKYEPWKFAVAPVVGAVVPIISGELSLSYFADAARLTRWSAVASDTLGTTFTTLASITPSNLIDALKKKVGQEQPH
jgi:hypothetical protein